MVEGERQFTRDNKTLGQFRLDEFRLQEEFRRLSYL
ncbi:MAG: hypothetical protein ACLUEJ_13930 [Clostridium sp.]